MTTNENLDLLIRVKGLFLRLSDLRERAGERQPNQPTGTHVARFLLEQADNALNSAQANLGHCPHCLAQMEDELDDDRVTFIKDTVHDDLVFHPEAFECSAEQVAEIELAKAEEYTESADFLLTRAELLLPAVGE